MLLIHFTVILLSCTVIKKNDGDVKQVTTACCSLIASPSQLCHAARNNPVQYRKSFTHMERKWGTHVDEQWAC